MLINLALRNTSRNRRRTLLTALTVLLGTALLTLALSFLDGVVHTFTVDGSKNTGHVRVVTKAYADKDALNPLYENIADTAPVVEVATAIDGVTGVYPRIQMPVMVSEGDEIGDTYGLLVGAPLAYYTDVLELEARVIDGAMITDPKKEALIGTALAEVAGLEAGDEALFMGATQDGSPSPLAVTVAGVVDTGNGAFDRQIFVDLDQVRWVADIPDGAIEVLLFLDNPDRADAVAAELATLGDDLVAQSWNEREPLRTMLAMFGKVGAVLSGVIVFVTALGVLNTMMMSVLERTGEIGVLRAMGLQNREVVTLFVIEAMVIALTGGLIGVLLGSGVAIALGQTGIDLGEVADAAGAGLAVNRTLQVLWTPIAAGQSLALGFVVAVLGSAIPAFRATTIQPVDAMRSRR